MDVGRWGKTGQLPAANTRLLLVVVLLLLLLLNVTFHVAFWTRLPSGLTYRAVKYCVDVAIDDYIIRFARNRYRW